MAWFIALLIGIALNILSYLLMPKPKGAQPQEVKDIENPEPASGPKPTLFGTKPVKGLGIIWYGDKSKKTYKVDVGGGKK